MIYHLEKLFFNSYNMHTDTHVQTFLWLCRALLLDFTLYIDHVDPQDTTATASLFPVSSQSKF